jgi:hypothetical protein
VYENGKMQHAPGMGMMKGVNLTKYIVSTFVNVTTYPQ